MRFYFFGVSFVRLFSLLQSRDFKVHGFKGATAKGLGRESNANRGEIEEILTANEHLEHAVFVFGNVDVHLTPYFLKYGRGGEEVNLEAIAREYVRFVAGLPGTAEKLTYLTEDLGFDGALNYKVSDEELDRQIGELCPDGVSEAALVHPCVHAAVHGGGT